jgi:hypothetical protein
MTSDPQFSWLREVMVPAFFTVIGSALGFMAGQLRDGWKARHAKQSFLQAIGMELDALSVQLSGSLGVVKKTFEEVSSGNRTNSTFAMKWRTIVFTSQLGKLRDLGDPLLIEIVHFYSDLGMLDEICDEANDFNARFNRPDVPSGSSGSYRTSLGNTLKALERTLLELMARLKALRAELPPPEATSAGR